jgi:hypothetical protein
VNDVDILQLIDSKIDNTKRGGEGSRVGRVPW